MAKADPRKTSRTPAPQRASAYDDVLGRVRRGEQTAEQGAAELLAQLSQEERLGLLDGDLGLWPGLAAFFIRGYNHKPLVAGAVERLGIPGVRFADGPRGVVMGRSTCFPVTSSRGASWEVELEEEIGRAVGLEARVLGANLFGGVTADVLRHPRWGRAQESYGEDPVHAGVMAAALTRGVRQHVMACVKHFALYSIENSRFSVDVQAGEEAMHEAFLPPYRAALDAGADAVMTAYHSVNGEWAGQNQVLLSGILRDEWGFTGFAISDFVWGIRDAVKSVLAGLDIEMPFAQTRARTLPGALREQRLSPADIDRSALRILAGQLRHQAALDEQIPTQDAVACEEHRSLARRAATAGMVLLRNEPLEEGNAPVLPLGLEVGSLAVFGRLADQANLGDGGSSAVKPPYTVSPLAGLRAVLPGTRIDYHPGSDVAAAAELARPADAALIVVGWDGSSEGEAFLVNDPQAAALLGPPFSNRFLSRAFVGLFRLLAKTKLFPSGGDRERLSLSEQEQHLILSVAAANPRTIVVVIGGSSAVIETWRWQVPAILMVWYPGMEGGHALADVIAGIAEPGGRLPTVMPADPAHLPDFDNTARQVHFDWWWGQRKLDRDGRSAAYPFGFGLGYTTFELSDLSAEAQPGTGVGTDVGTVEASVTVSNTGRRSGSTVVQLYAVTDTPALSERPYRQLLGFAKLQLGAGESRRVSLKGTLQPLARRDPTTRNWSLVGGSYRLEAAQYSGDPEAAGAALLLPP